MTHAQTAELDVVITTYNSAEYIQECLESLAVIRESWSLYIVDNGSSDETLDIVQRVAPGATVIRSGENLGFGQGINRGAVAGSSNLMLVLNPDAVLVSDITAIVARVRAQEVIAAGLMLNSAGELRSNAFDFPTWSTVFKVSKAHVPKAEILDRLSTSPTTTVDYIEGSFFVIRRSTWERLGGFSSEYFMYGEDRDLSRRALEMGVRTELVNAAVFQHDGGFSPRRQPWYVQGSLLYTRRYHRGRFWPVWTTLSGKFLIKGVAATLQGDRERAEASRATLSVLMRWLVERPPIASMQAGAAAASGSVSVILPTYNRAPTIERACKSVLTQGDAVLELIVVDDGSTDDTERIVRELGKEDERVRYVRQGNAGACVARNHGISLSRGDLIAFQDSDDEWLPGKLAAQLETRGNTQSLVFTAHTVVFPDGTQEIRPYPGASLSNRQLLQHNFISTQTALLDRSVLGAARFDERLTRLQDWDLWLSLVETSNVPIKYVPRPLVNLYRQEDSATNSQENYYRSLAVIVRKHSALYLRNPYAGAKVLGRLLRHQMGRRVRTR